MRKLKLFLIAFSFGCCSITAETLLRSDIIGDPGTINFQQSSSSYGSALNPVMYHEKTGNTLNIKNVLYGTLMIAGGTVLAVNGYYTGKAYYSRYKRSAFTANTDKIRRNVVISNAKLIGGSIIAGIGVTVVVFSF